MPSAWGKLPRLAGLLCLALGACATPQTDLVLTKKDQYATKAEVRNVPFYPQEEFYCGPAALAMVLSWSGLPTTQEDIAKQVYIPSRQGTLRNDILAAARRNGRLAFRVDSLSALIAEIANGHPVLVFQNLAFDWYPRWHYAVAFGYDLAANNLLLRSGSEARLEIDLATFERTWRRGGYWALTVLPPEKLPATVAETAALDAAANIARLGHHAEAAKAFETIASRWPQSFIALMGLGNEHYALKKWQSAEHAYRTAIATRRSAASAWNNLAHALAKQGRRDEAVDAARKAVALGGMSATTYQDTLAEVSASIQ